MVAWLVPYAPPYHLPVVDGQRPRVRVHLHHPHHQSSPPTSIRDGPWPTVIAHEAAAGHQSSVSPGVEWGRGICLSDHLPTYLVPEALGDEERVALLQHRHHGPLTTHRQARLVGLEPGDGKR